MALSEARKPRPLRAMMSAHLRAHWVGSRRQSGRVGRWARTALGGGVVLGYIVVIAGGMGFFGWTMRDVIRRDRAAPEALLAGLLTGYVLIFGATAAVEGITRRLPWEQLRVFPVHTRTLFIAELCASALDLSSLGPMLGLLAFSTAASLRQPAATPAFVGLFVTHAMLLLTLPLVVGSILQRASRSLRLTLMLAPLLALMLGAFGTIELARTMPRETSLAMLEHVRDAVFLLPSHALLSAATALERGTLTPQHALAAALGPLAAMLIMLLAAYWAITRETPVGPRHDANARLWTFKRPVWGIARLQWAMLLGSMPGRFALAFPLFAAMVGRGFSVRRDPSYAVTFSFVYCSFGLVGLLSNQFGLDRHGVKVLLLLPLDERTILRGKLLGHALLAAAQASVLATALAVFGAASAHAIAVGLATHGCMFLMLALIGTPCSVWAPRPIRTRGMRSPAPLRMWLVLFGAVPLFGALIGGVMFATLYWLPGWELPVAGALFVLLLGAFELLLRVSARHMARHRERMMEQLSGAA